MDLTMTACRRTEKLDSKSHLSDSWDVFQTLDRKLRLTPIDPIKIDD